MNVAVEQLQLIFPDMIEVLSESEIAVTVENEHLKSRVIVCENPDETFSVMFAYSSLE